MRVGLTFTLRFLRFLWIFFFEIRLDCQTTKSGVVPGPEDDQ